MESPKQRATEIIQALTRELPGLMQRATDIALDEFSSTRLLVQELESLGFRIQIELESAIMAVPLEAAFERKLTDTDRMFLRLLKLKVGD